MAKSVGQGFQTFLSWLQPLESERQKATNHRGSVKSCLENRLGCYQFTETGSFGNGTGVRHYSDVDYFAAIPVKTLTNDSSYFLRKMKETLQGTFSSTRGIEVNSPAVQIPFGNYASESMEITPCNFNGMVETPAGKYPLFEIPDGRGGWMRSCPQAHTVYVRQVDTRLNGKLKPIIQLVKAWKFMQSVPIISFYLEIRAAQFLSGSVIFSYDEAVLNFLRHLQQIGLAAVRDPMGVSGLISSSKSEIQKSSAVTRLDTAVSRAEKAYQARLKGNEDEAFRYWKLLFSQEFPSR